MAKHQEKPEIGPGDPELFNYRVKGSQAVLRHAHEDYRDGDTVWCTKNQALANKWILEPVDEDGRFEAPQSTIDEGKMKLMRGHEKQEILEKEKEELQKRLADVDKRLEDVQKEIGEEKKKKADAVAAVEKASEAKQQSKKETKATPAESKG